MSILQIISLIALAFCLVMMLTHFVRIVRLGKPKDFSIPSGNVTQGVVYSNTVAMMPTNKESAYMHLPTYAGGIIFHLGIFLSFLLYILSLFGVNDFYPEWLNIVLGLCVSVSALCGVLLLIKRLINKNLNSLANPDDYLSNLFTTLFQCGTALFLLTAGENGTISAVYYILCTLLFIYMPWGKLKHLVYYFSARYHLGFFYGWRNVWPPQKEVK
ncbi:MAG: hypothetical protein J5642_05030 [Bacteroidales bacterium]|nr:hypothetical protein [Bacteroidales bacterium]